MPESINLTPVGLQTPEGEQRVARALKAFEESHPTVANLATVFLHRYGGEIKQYFIRRDDTDAAEEFGELYTAILERDRTQEEFLRAVAGAPAEVGGDGGGCDVHSSGVFGCNACEREKAAGQ